MSKDQENLLRVIGGPNVDHAELVQLIQFHFGQAHAITPRRVEYHRNGEIATALTLVYNKRGTLTSIERGSSLRNEDISELKQKVNACLVETTGDIVERVVVFAAVPSEGYFRYREAFQLLPVPANAPRPNTTVGDHPLLLEFRVRGSADHMVQVLRRTRKARELELLCGALISHFQWSIGSSAGYHWVLESTDALQRPICRYLQEFYWLPEDPWPRTELALVENISPMPVVSAAQYYTSRGITAGQFLTLPDNFSVLISKFRSLSLADRDKFLRASYWFVHSTRVFTLSQSASFTALASAIEALMPEPVRAPACSACRRSPGPGPTLLFSAFIEKYAPSPAASAEDRRSLYDLRSALSHGGKLLHGDHLAWSIALTPGYIDQRKSMTVMWQTVRIALVKWLEEKGSSIKVNSDRGAAVPHA